MFNVSRTFSEKVVHICTKKFFPKFEIIRMGNTGLLEKETRWPRLASGIEYVPECKKDKERR